MKRKVLVGTMVVAMGLLLTGCCMKHEWKDANCIEPRTCTKCGETEGSAIGHTWRDATCIDAKKCGVCEEIGGEALGHTWIEATCVEPRTCSTCGVTEGEERGHDLQEANYQQAAVCNVCGETVGETLEADFESYGLVCNAELDIVYPYHTMCYSNEEYSTIGTVTFSDYVVMNECDYMEIPEGYVCQAITLTYVYDDENASMYGMWSQRWMGDYYNNEDEAEDLDEDGVYTYVLSFWGREYEECKMYWEDVPAEWDNDVYTLVTRHYFCVPEGYDGTVIAAYDRRNMTSDNMRIDELVDENTVIYRLPAAVIE